jgi:hypothetical protein
MAAQHAHHAVSVPALHGPFVAAAPVIATPPVIDGTLAPGEWDSAARYSGLTQTEPAEGEPMSERTEVFVSRDADRLYLAFAAYDSEIGRIRADLTPRDDFTASADVVGVVIDPRGTRSRGLYFFFNPLGVQYDGVWTRGPDPGWDGVLVSRGSLEADRFVVEVAIPLSTLLTGGRAQEEWDINFFRQIPRKGEEGWWAPVPRAGTRNLLEYSGRLTGLADLDARTRFELIPTATLDGGRGDTPEDRLGGSWGATLRVPVSPAVRLEGTYRPDFNAVESDDAQIGFNERYALYYPEKRPFFLEGKDRFETPGASFVSDPLRLVHTRTIVRPRLGMRLLASPEGGFVGGMLLAEERPDGSRDGTSAVLRGRLEGRGGAQVGLTATRRARAGGENTAVAADAQLRLPAQVVLTLQAARSLTAVDSTGERRPGTAAYLDLARETGRSFQQVVYRRIGRDFETELGFVPRRDLQQVVSHAGVYLRPARTLRTMVPMIQHVVGFDESGRRVDEEYLPHIELVFARQTSVWIGHRFGEEVYRDRPYAQGRFEVRARSSPLPWLDLSIGGKTGRRIRYDAGNPEQDRTFVADFREAQGSVEGRIGRAASLSATTLWHRLGGAAGIPARDLWLGRVRAAYQLDAATYLRAILQYDPDLRRGEGSLLLGRELNYGTQVHVGVEYASAGEPPATGPGAQRRGFARVSYLLRR